MRKHFILGIMALAALASCTKSEVLNQESLAEKGISFSAYAGKAAQTKATTIDLENVGDAGIGVLAWRGESSNDITETELNSYAPTFMKNTKLETEDDGATWTYAPQKYWPSTGAKVSFFAYAPHKDATVSYDPAGTDNIFHQENITIDATQPEAHKLTLNVPYLDDEADVNSNTGNAYALQTDFMVSRVTEENQNLNKDYEGKVQLNMKHALSKISFVAKAGNTTGQYDGAIVSIDNIKIEGEFASKGTYNLYTEQWSDLTPLTEYNYINDDDVTNDPFNAIADELINAGEEVEGMEGWYHLTKKANDLMVIPFTTSGAANITRISGKYIVQTVDENRAAVIGEENRDEINFELPVNMELVAGKSYIFKLNIELKKIEFSVDVEEWESAGTVNVIDNFIQDAYAVTDRASFDRLPYKYIKDHPWDDASTPASLPWLAIELRSVTGDMHVTVKDKNATDPEETLYNKTLESLTGVTLLTLSNREDEMNGSLVAGKTYVVTITVGNITKSVEIELPQETTNN